jgi:cation diffusion facilitator family transporter
MKLIVGIMSGSVSIISEAIHSSVDLLAAMIAFFSVNVSDKPADEKHPYGHGKIENVSGVIEAILIFIASAAIIFKAIEKLINPSSVKSAGLAFLVMFVSAAVNTVVSRQLYKTAKAEESIALEADALHLKADVLTSLGVGTGLLLIWATKLYFLDPIVALAVAIFILREAYSLLKTAFGPLLDVTLPDSEIKVIEASIDKHKDEYCGYHRLKTRRSGSQKYIDMHLVVPDDMPAKTAHNICNTIEKDIDDSLKNSEVMIHIESCNNKCPGKECKHKNAAGF